MLKCVKALAVLVSLLIIPTAAYAQASIVGTVDETGANDSPGRDAKRLAAWACAALSAASWRSLSTAGRSSSTGVAATFFCASSSAPCLVRPPNPPIAPARVLVAGPPDHGAY